MRMCVKITGGALAAAVLFSATAHAAVVAGTYETIDISGSPTQFAGVPVAASNSVDPAAGVDPISLQIANDGTSLYLDVTYATAETIPAGLYLAIDSDNSPSTGYNTYGSSTIGANAGFVNDYPFGESAGVFNTYSATFTSASSTLAGMNILEQGQAYTGTAVTSELLSIALDTVQTDTSAGGYSGLLFPDTFTLEAYTSPTTGDAVVLGPVTYTLASPVAVPEPASLSLLALGAIPMLRRRRQA